MSARCSTPTGLTIMPGVDRHPGPLPRAGPGVEGGPGKRLPRRRAGRSRGGVRNAQHRAHDHRPRTPSPTSSPAPRTGCTATMPSTLGAPTRTPAGWESWSACRAAAGSRCSWAPPPAPLRVRDDEGIEQVAAPCEPARGLPPGGRIPPCRPPPAGPHRRLDQPLRKCRDAQSAIQSTEELVRIADRARQAHPRPPRDRTAQEIAFLAAHKDVASVELTPQHLTLAGPEAYKRPEGLRPDEPADPRRRSIARPFWAGPGQRGRRRAGLRPRAAHQRGEGPALPRLAVGHAWRSDPAAGNADPCCRGPPDPGAAGRPDQPWREPPVRARRQGPPGRGLRRRPDHRRSESSPHDPTRHDGGAASCWTPFDAGWRPRAGPWRRSSAGPW